MSPGTLVPSLNYAYEKLRFSLTADFVRLTNYYIIINIIIIIISYEGILFNVA